MQGRRGEEGRREGCGRAASQTTTVGFGWTGGSNGEGARAGPNGRVHGVVSGPRGRSLAGGMAKVPVD